MSQLEDIANVHGCKFNGFRSADSAVKLDRHWRDADCQNHDNDIVLTELNTLASGNDDVSGLLRYCDVGVTLRAGEDDEETVETAGLGLALGKKFAMLVKRTKKVLNLCYNDNSWHSNE